MSPSTTAQQHSDDIDALLQQYLVLLDTYTSLRHDLSRSLSSIHQLLARANFSAPRGVRYGQDLYDERMQASSLCVIEPCDDDASSSSSSSSPAGVLIAVRDMESNPTSNSNPMPSSEPSESPIESELNPESKTGGGDMQEQEQETESDQDTKHEQEQEQEDAQEEQTYKSPPALRMFGILVPPSLRAAQAASDEMVRGLVPRIAQTDLEMREVEVRIRRARKRMGRAAGEEVRGRKVEIEEVVVV